MAKPLSKKTRVSRVQQDSGKVTKRRAKQYSSISKLKTLAKIKITASTDISKYLPTPPVDMVKPRIWELQNRKSFFQWLQTTFNKYDTSNPVQVAKVNQEGINPNPDRSILQLFPIQKLVRDFMATESPYRGILLYFGLGVGKTLSAIAVSEGILNKRQVIVISKASLDSNFRDTIMNAGQDYMVKNNYWVFTELTGGNQEAEKLRELLNIPETVAKENGGIYLIDFSVMRSNYNELSQQHRDGLNNQIQALVNTRFRFVHWDDNTVLRKVSQEDFHDKVIIVDEVHNMTNNMTKPVGKGATFYNMFMNAKNSKFIFLTGTPIINQVFEASRLFNILRGYIPVLEYKLQVSFDLAIDYRKIRAILKQNKHIDQIIINQVNRIIKITKNPDYYVTSTDPANPGLVYVPNQPVVTIEQLRDDVEKIFKALGYKYNLLLDAKSEIKRETCLPEDPEEFEKSFYNPELNKIKKPDVLKKRIAGLLSFYDYKDPNAFPELTAGSPYIIQCPMSSYQLGIYESVRHVEIQKDTKMARRRKGDDDVTKSTYRLLSRLACSFVYPEEYKAVYDGNKTELFEQMVDTAIMTGELEDGEISSDMAESAIEKYIKENIMAGLKKNRRDYFNIASGALARYSPKYVEMIKNINKSTGLVLVYSYFLTMVGLNMFALALDETGEWAPFEIKKVNKEWHLVTNNPDFKSPNSSSNSRKKSSAKQHARTRARNFYVFYSGRENAEYRNIIKYIYNSQFDELGDNCQPLKESLKKLYSKDENLHGQVIKMLMTTKTGAEGLDLKNVRSVHITEPYWQPVLIEQVIGRAVRNNSHIRLPPSERNVAVYMYMASIPGHMVNKLVQADVRADYAKYNDGLNMKGRVATSDEALFITSEHKKVITNQLTTLMKESAFDCTLNYAVNSKQHPGIVCLDYDTRDRDEYLFTAGLEDTQDIIALNQEIPVVEDYTKFIIGAGFTYYVSNFPTPDGNYFIYDESITNKVRKPVPVGVMMIKDGKKVYRFSPSEKAKWTK